MAGTHRKKAVVLISGFLVLLVMALLTSAYTPAYMQNLPLATPTPQGNNSSPSSPNQVNVVPSARDEQIRQRLQSILDSTGWFVNPGVKVKDGVVFLTGATRSTDYKTWAGNLASNTQDVVAVVNKIELIQPSIWNLKPAISALQDFARSLVGSIPLVIFCLLVLGIAWIVIRLSMAATRVSLGRYLHNPLLGNVAAYTLGILIFMVTVYIILQIAGLTNAATTIVGGTGLLGLILGIAFRDITENFLASIFLSLQTPFHTQDLVKVGDVMGFVQALTIRVTILMTLDGTIVQIPNATVYKSNIYNYTNNPNRQADFSIGIGYNDSVVEAQDLAMQVLTGHPAILKDPEPLVLVESLGSSSVNLHIYYWLNCNQNSWLKVKSSVIRLMKSSFQSAGISMPDEAREVIFPQGVPVQWSQTGETLPGTASPVMPRPPQEPEAISTRAEAGLRSEAEDIKEQARTARIPAEGENLLDQSPSDGK